MYAITIPEPGGPDALVWTAVADPEPGPGEVAIDIVASSVNRADLMQRRGFYPPPKGATDLPGLECSGKIASIGADVTDWQPGDEVCALLAGGGYAQRVVAPAGQVTTLPPGVDLVTAGGLPEIACTVWSNLVQQAGLQPEQLLLVHGGSGGIGTHAVQVGAALGATVAVTASAQRLEFCRELGASITIDYSDQDFAAELRGRCDVILDNMGAKYLQRNVEALAPDGHLVVIGLQGGTTAELNLGAMLGKRATVSATGLRARPIWGPAGKAEIVRAVTEELWPLIGNGKVQPIMHATMPMARAAEAHQMLEDGGVLGKIMLVNE